MSRSQRVEKIISGGQTGADRAALDVARELGIATGGWVPLGRQAEDGALPPDYAGLVETEAANPAVRTGRNVRDSDATLIVSHGALSGGSLLTERRAKALGRPCLHVDLDVLGAEAAAAELRAWLTLHRPRALNVAGPRASGNPAIYDATRQLLRAALSDPRFG